MPLIILASLLLLAIVLIIVLLAFRIQGQLRTRRHERLSTYPLPRWVVQEAYPRPKRETPQHKFHALPYHRLSNKTNARWPHAFEDLIETAKFLHHLPLLSSGRPFGRIPDGELPQGRTAYVVLTTDYYRWVHGPSITLSLSDKWSLRIFPHGVYLIPPVDVDEGFVFHPLRDLSLTMAYRYVYSDGEAWHIATHLADVPFGSVQFDGPLLIVASLTVEPLGIELLSSETQLASRLADAFGVFRHTVLDTSVPERMQENMTFMAQRNDAMVIGYRQRIESKRGVEQLATLHSWAQIVGLENPSAYVLRAFEDSQYWSGWLPLSPFEQIIELRRAGEFTTPERQRPGYAQRLQEEQFIYLLMLVGQIEHLISRGTSSLVEEDERQQAILGDLITFLYHANPTGSMDNLSVVPVLMFYYTCRHGELIRDAEHLDSLVLKDRLFLLGCYAAYSPWGYGSTSLTVLRSPGLFKDVGRRTYAEFTLCLWRLVDTMLSLEGMPSKAVTTRLTRFEESIVEEFGPWVWHYGIKQDDFTSLFDSADHLASSTRSTSQLNIYNQSLLNLHRTSYFNAAMHDAPPKGILPILNLIGPPGNGQSDLIGALSDMYVNAFPTGLQRVTRFIDLERELTGIRYKNDLQADHGHTVILMYPEKGMKITEDMEKGLFSLNHFFRSDAGKSLIVNLYAEPSYASYKLFNIIADGVSAPVLSEVAIPYAPRDVERIFLQKAYSLYVGVQGVSEAYVRKYFHDYRQQEERPLLNDRFIDELFNLSMAQMATRVQQLPEGKPIDSFERSIAPDDISAAYAELLSRYPAPQ
ncbi:MAG: hypothetical protein CSA97_01330 [Bacteroidetes bacterium]|nr:MAG: hypothetical protein CSA97_01330 [Bacteroidota bacterium]